MTLGEIGEKAGVLEYKTVGKAVQRFGQRIRNDRKLRSIAHACLAQMSNVET